jgi:hypothetical protein
MPIALDPNVIDMTVDDFDVFRLIDHLYKHKDSERTDLRIARDDAGILLAEYKRQLARRQSLGQRNVIDTFLKDLVSEWENWTV